MSHCKNKKCGCSTGICGRPTFGSGYLDDHGYWERPCRECAAEYERTTGKEAWPCEDEQAEVSE